ncbi:PEGA domain-containing protein, partial [Pyxidicoccus sp. 3LFB2]
PPPPPAPEGMSMGKKVALVALPLLLIGVGAAVVMGTQGGGTQPGAVTPREATTPKPLPVAAGNTVSQPNTASQNILVSFSSTPSGASIYEGEEMLGTTPIKLELPRDKVYGLSFRLSGHKNEERTLNFSRIAGDSQSVDVTLEPVRAAPTPRATKPPKPSGGQDISVFE